MTARTDLETQLRDTAHLAGESLWPNEHDVVLRESPTARTQRILRDETPDIVFAMLQKYQDEGIIDLGDPRILQIPPLDTMGTPLQLIKQFGTRADFMFAVQDLQSALYQKEA